MRSPKNRSRSKSNRSRTLGNVINRVFDSSGPEGKVRGTPQQIIDKYNQLTRDAQLSNDRVAAENFQQHAEHYLRLLAEATREQEARREQSEREPRWNHQDRNTDRSEQENSPQRRGGEGTAQPESNDDSFLVVTPENAPVTTNSVRQDQPSDAPAPAPAAAAVPESETASSGAPEAVVKKSPRSRSTSSRTTSRSSTRKKSSDSEAPTPAPVDVPAKGDGL